VRQRLTRSGITRRDDCRRSAKTRNSANKIYSGWDADSRIGFATVRGMAVARNKVLPQLARGMRTSVQPVATIGGAARRRPDIKFVIKRADLRKLEQVRSSCSRA